MQEDEQQKGQYTQAENFQPQDYDLLVIMT